MQKTLKELAPLGVLKEKRPAKKRIYELEDSVHIDPMQVLPLEISMHILGFLPVAALANASRVCMEWNYAASGSNLPCIRLLCTFDQDHLSRL